MGEEQTPEGAMVMVPREAIAQIVFERFSPNKGWKCWADCGVLGRPTYLEAADSILSMIAAIQQSPEGWQDISTHDNSMTEVQVMAAGFKTPITAWRHHPSSRTDRWLSVPGRYQVKPTHFRPLPPVPSVSGEGGR